MDTVGAVMQIVVFLLTRPSRDVTKWRIPISLIFHISTHTSLAGRDKICQKLGMDLDISTHTSLAGRDVLPASVQIYGP